METKRGTGLRQQINESITYSSNFTLDDFNEMLTEFAKNEKEYWDRRDKLPSFAEYLKQENIDTMEDNRSYIIESKENGQQYVTKAYLQQYNSIFNKLTELWNINIKQQD
jgi:hypothetical protein